MTIIDSKTVQVKEFNSDGASNVVGKLLIGKKTGATHFVMRMFEIGPDGHTPLHSHPWEHEVFVHAGRGAVLKNGEWVEIKMGDALFIPEKDEHQFKNTGPEPLVILCLIPSGAPEL